MNCFTPFKNVYYQCQISFASKVQVPPNLPSIRHYHLEGESTAISLCLLKGHISINNFLLLSAICVMASHNHLHTMSLIGLISDKQKIKLSSHVRSITEEAWNKYRRFNFSLSQTWQGSWWKAHLWIFV